jgi:hypothetical protein
MKFSTASLLFILAGAPSAAAFVPSNPNIIHTPKQSATTRLNQSTIKIAQSEELIAAKKELLELLGNKKFQDSVLADPNTKEPVEITTPGVLLGGASSRRRNNNVQYKIQSASNNFEGSTDTFIDLLEPITTTAKIDDTTDGKSRFAGILKQTIPYIPVPFRQRIASLTDGEFVPMRDLFTSPAVSFAYERGWRQGFAAAGFPGPDDEFTMAKEYFAPVVADVGADKAVIVDMSCATGKCCFQQ